MVAPLVPVVLIGTGVATVVGGAASGARGTVKFLRARATTNTARERYEREIEATQVAGEATDAAVHAYGDRQAERLDEVVHRMARFLERNQQRVAERASDLLDGVVIDVGRLEDFTGARLTAEGLAAHITAAAAAGAATYTGVPLAVAASASASTGTAITSLSGAAATNATMAWLGGGSLAAGGGGMALGMAALNFVTVGPTVLVGGLVLNGKGEKALTEAREYTTEVEVSIEEQRVYRSRLALIERRVDELQALLDDLATRGVLALDELEAREPFNPERDTEPFRRALAYAIAVRDVVSTPVLADEGEIDPQTANLLVTYRTLR